MARIFNTYGPRMSGNDGRVVSNFIVQALQGQNITIYGTGAQTRSFQHVHDLVSGLIALMESDYSQPVNIGNPEEYTILEVRVRSLVRAAAARGRRAPTDHATAAPAGRCACAARPVCAVHP